MMSKIRFKPVMIFAVSLGALVLFVSAGTAAQSFDLNMVTDIPSFTHEMPIEEYYAHSQVFEQTPSSQPYLAYRVRLPENWGEEEEGFETLSTRNVMGLRYARDRRGRGSGLHGSLSDNEGLGSGRLMDKVGVYYGNAYGPVASRLEVLSSRLDYGIAARNWIYQYILDNGYVLQGMKEHSRRRVEVLYVKFEGEFPFYVRSQVELHGSRLMMASYYLPEAGWEQERALQNRVIDDFKFTAPRESDAELAQTFNFFDMVYFNYPVTWRMVQPNIYSAEGMDAQLLFSADQRTLMGEINIHIVSTELDTTLAQEVGYLKEDLRDMGFQIGNLIEEPDGYNFHDHIYFNRIEAYQAHGSDPSMIGYEYWFAVMAESRYYYLVTMLTPAREDDFFTWARNVEAFETLVQSLRPHEEQEVAGP